MAERFKALVLKDFAPKSQAAQVIELKQVF
jgi:predicted component of type VI protein secretion system